MPTSLQHSIDLLAQGLLTEVPSQLVTAAVLAASAAALRAWRRRRPASRPEEEGGDGDG
ncbi:hypothetical protein ACWGDE_06435 [Streptomyces sp. NPDC054956]